MKTYNYTQLFKILLITAFAIFFATSCNDNEDDSLGPLYGYASSENAIAQKVNLELKMEQSVERKFNFVSRRKAAEDIDISYQYDASLVDVINKKLNKNYIAYVPESFSLSKDIVTIKSGNMVSDSITIDIKYNETMEMGKEYIIPLRASVKKGELIIPEKDSYIAFIVKSLGDNTEKSTGIKVFSCMEINNENPLNHLNYKLKNSDKYLFDVVILFSTNVHYNHKTKKVQISLNEQNRFLFDNIDKYVKPLQDVGIKVIFGLTPHGALDGLSNPVGISNLTDDACREFALEIKRFTDHYGLDGIFLDDEYGYNKGDGPGDPSVLLPTWSYEASSRLAFEIDKVMPDKIVSIYAYSYLGQMVNVEGKEPGTFVDYVLPDYGDSRDYSEMYKGVPMSGLGINSINLPGWNIENQMKQLRERGFGANMVYGLKANYSSHNESLEILTKALFDDELVVKDEYYKSDWSHLSGEKHKNWSDK